MNRTISTPVHAITSATASMFCQTGFTPAMHLSPVCLLMRQAASPYFIQKKHCDLYGHPITCCIQHWTCCAIELTWLLARRLVEQLRFHRRNLPRTPDSVLMDYP